MKKSKHAAAAVSAAALAAVVVTGGISASAAGGSESDPLVTLSYLTQVVTPQLMSEVDKQVAANEQTLVDKLNAAISTYSGDMAAGQGTDSGVSYVVVSVQAGQTLKPSVGCELLLRIGAAKVSADSSPGLVDTTTGGTLENGEALVTNHLYLTTIAGRGVTFSAAGKILVRGSYTLS